MERYEGFLWQDFSLITIQKNKNRAPCGFTLCPVFLSVSLAEGVSDVVGPSIYLHLVIPPDGIVVELGDVQIDVA